MSFAPGTVPTVNFRPKSSMVKVDSSGTGRDKSHTLFILNSARRWVWPEKSVDGFCTVKYSRIISVLIAAAAGIVILNSGSAIRPAATQGNEKTAEQVYKNIQVFKGLPASQLLGAMNFMAGSLGVSCNHCHVPNQFAKDEKPAKQTARQ